MGKINQDLLKVSSERENFKIYLRLFFQLSISFDNSLTNSG